MTVGTLAFFCLIVGGEPRPKETGWGGDTVGTFIQLVTLLSSVWLWVVVNLVLRGLGGGGDTVATFIHNH